MYLSPVSLSSVANAGSTTPLNKSSATQDNAGSFGDTLKAVAAQMENLDRQYLSSQVDLVLGNARDMHTAVINAEKASLALDLVIAFRNKAIEAYQEIMRMPV